jgi:hypothetical protein
MAVARTNPSLEIVRFFVGQDPGCVDDADAAVSLPVHVAVSKTNVDLELVRVLAEARPMTLLTADATGSLPLHLALQRQDIDLKLVQYLLEQRPQALQHKNSRGLLPMHDAAAAAKTVADEPPDVLFLLASKWPQAVFGEGGGVAVVDATSPQKPRQRPPKCYNHS